MITEDYVSFETAKLLKEKGFDAECDYLYVDGELVRAHGCARNWNKGETLFTDYKNECSAPTLQMAMKWLREKDWVICILPLTFYCGEKASSWGYNIWAGDNLEVDEENTPKFTTYEEASESAIRYCLENLIQL